MESQLSSKIKALIWNTEKNRTFYSPVNSKNVTKIYQNEHHLIENLIKVFVNKTIESSSTEKNDKMLRFFFKLFFNPCPNSPKRKKDENDVVRKGKK